eukprot:2331783-Rhodomonas_salina.3
MSCTGIAYSAKRCSGTEIAYSANRCKGREESTNRRYATLSARYQHTYLLRARYEQRTLLARYCDSV